MQPNKKDYVFVGYIFGMANGMVAVMVWKNNYMQCKYLPDISLLGLKI